VTGSQKRIIVSRHAGAVEFVRRELPEFADAPVLASVTAADVHGAEVAGNLPLDLAAQADVVYAITFAGQPPRGQEYTLDDMDAAGASIRGFVVVTKSYWDALIGRPQ
jgi:hypothetical protein